MAVLKLEKNINAVI